MTKLERVGRTVIATGGVATPGIERLSDGDLLVSYRKRQPNGLGWNGEVKRSTDGGRMWSEPVFRTQSTRPNDPTGFMPYHGMLQLPGGTVLLPCRGADGGVFLFRSEDNGVLWTGPERIGESVEGVRDWLGIQPYGKLRLLSDGTLIMPVWGRFRGDRLPLTGHLRSSDAGVTWDELVVIARGQVAYNETVELPDGRLMAIIGNEDSPTGHGMAPFLWSWSEDMGRTWTEPELTSQPVYGSSPSLFMTKKGTLLCGFRWLGDLDQGFVGVGLSAYLAEDGWNGVWSGRPTIVWLGKSVQSAVGGRSFAGYPSFAYADDERILCTYFMSSTGGADPATLEIEGVFFVEAD